MNINVTTSDPTKVVPSVPCPLLYFSESPVLLNKPHGDAPVYFIGPHDGAHVAVQAWVKGITRTGGHVGRSRGSGTSSQATDVMT